MSQEPRPEEYKTYSEPEVRVVEEVGEDGKIIRKTIKTRKVTHHVVTAVPTTTTTTTTTTSSSSSSSSSSAIVSSSSTSSSSEHVHEKTITSSSSTSSIEAAVVSESEKESTVSSSSSTSATQNGSLKQRLAHQIHDHPYYRFLNRFPLKVLPAQYVRPKLTKAVIYCFGPDARAPAKTENADQEKEQEKEAAQHQDSFDVDSLVWITYLKFNKIDFDIKYVTEPTMSPSGKLPFLALPSGELITHSGFEQWVQENRPSEPCKLSLQEAADAAAYSTLVETKILAALNYTLWFEMAHFKTTTRQRYFGHHNKYLGILLSYLRKSDIVQRMLLVKPQVDRELIFEEASAALEALSVALGDKSEGYFFGKEPSSLDAILFAYLHVILRLPAVRDLHPEDSSATTADGSKATELTRMVRKHENLVQYALRVWNKCYA
ncbi:metaxin 1 [Actinomortierella ambigua]|nr:metaxin 1 [Actinomortierella ambigua]